MAAARPARALALYRALRREADKLSHYNFRSYALRRVHDAFKENKNVTEPKEVQKLLDFAQENLEIIRRQAIIQHMYKSDKMIIENQGRSG